MYVGFGSPIHLHSNIIFLPSSDCRVTGRSVKAGLKPSAGTGTSSPRERAGWKYAGKQYLWFKTVSHTVGNYSSSRSLNTFILLIQKSAFLSLGFKHSLRYYHCFITPMFWFIFNSFDRTFIFCFTHVTFWLFLVCESWFRFRSDFQFIF